MIQAAIAKLVEKESLSFEEAKAVFDEIFNQKALPSQIASFLTALRIKKETEAEISAAASVVRERAKKIEIKSTPKKILDTCGTGGSGVDKFNISTAVSFVLAASGVKVAKHGNKAISSSCGSADVLEALGINIGAQAQVMEKAINKLGVGFLYAPLYHPALKTVATIRKELKIRTVFNILGPLCNPAFANYQLLGTYSPGLTLVMAKVLRKLGVKRALVIHGKDLGDEISLTGPTMGHFLSSGRIKRIKFTPSDFGLKKIKLKDIAGSSPGKSAAIIRKILSGQKGPARDIVLANAAACFYLLAEVNNLKKGVEMAAEILDSKRAYGLLEEFRLFLNSHA